MDKSQAEEFAKNFKKESGDEIIIWNSGIGFTVLRNYSDNIPFTPAKNKDGEIDSVCMLKVGFVIKEHDKDEEKLYLSVTKASRYLLINHFDYNFEDPKSPTRDSLEESKRSKQPFELENLTGYIYNKKTKKIIDIENKRKEVTLNEIIEHIYKSHLKTVKPEGFWFRSKISLKNITSIIEPIKNSLFWFLDFFLGKTIQSDKKDDFSVGTFKPYQHSSLYTLADEQIDLFNTGVKIPKKTAVVVAILISVMTLVFIYFYPAYWWSELKSQSQIVQASFLLFLIFIVDYVIPHIVLIVINSLVRFRIFIWNWKVKIK